jgi:VWFA-related protein
MTLLTPHYTRLLVNIGCPWTFKVNGDEMRRFVSISSALGCAAVLLAGLAALVVLPRAGGQERQPGTSATARMVEVTLVVTDRDGAPVTDLRSEEIRITDNGKPQKIASFEKLKADSAPVTPGQPAVYYVVVFDTMNTTYLDQPPVRLELLGSLGELGPGDRTYLLMLRTGLRLLHDYTAESPALLRKLAQRGAQPLPSSAAGLEAFSWVFDEIGPLNLFSPSTITPSRRNDLTFEAISTLAAKMARLQGRKSLLWISTGIMMKEAAGQTIDRFGDRLPPPDPRYLLNGIIEMTGRALNSADVAFYSIDARPLTVGNLTVTDMGAMRDLSRVSGGIAYPDRKGVKNAVREALDDSREVYWLTYSPTAVKEDGRFHQIKVQVSRGDNLKLRYRDGYTAPNPGSSGQP